MRDPAEPAGLHILFVQGRKRAVHAVEVTHQTLHTGMGRLVLQVPRQAPAIGPFRRLCKLTPHEQQLLARVGPHQAVKRAQVGKLLPGVARHLAQQRTLAVHHLIVREGKHKVFAEGVHQPESQQVLVVVAVHRIQAHVVQRIVHPAHIPFEVKAQTAAGQVGRGRAAHAGKSGGLFGNHQRTGALHAHQVVEAAQKIHGFQVFAPAMAVGNPLARRTAVIAVKHGSHGIHPQAVNTKTLQPIKGVADQKVAHLGAAEVVDQRIPVLVETLFRVGIFVQVRAIEIGQSMGIAGEVRRHPIQNHTQPGRVRCVHKILKIFRAAKARRR